MLPETASAAHLAAAQQKVKSVQRIAVVGNYLPRQCGIATFTTHLCEALAATHPDCACFVLPMNDTPEGYAYSPPVRFVLAQNDMVSYRAAADFLNINNIDLVCLQHEYGIFGGPAGSHVLGLIRQLRMPVVTTLHTILREPDGIQRLVMEELTELSDRLVVMSERGAEFLREVYGTPESKIDLIPHGIPDVPFVDPNFYKDKFGVQGKIVLLTFGLLSPNKGIEHVIKALPAVLDRFPNLVFMVVGATHPHFRRDNDESYRRSLQDMARTLSLDQNVVFHNRFVGEEELLEFIGAADIYITPYLNPAQSVSGTLAYSVGAGKAVISTPYWYAEELLSGNRGVVIPFADPDGLSAAVIRLLDNEAERHAMRKRAYLTSRQMVWSNVARLYMRTFERVFEDRRRNPRLVLVASKLSQRSNELPDLKLDHLETLTDDTGLLQHAIFTAPNYSEGYTTDDNARALILAVLLEQSEVQLSRALRYQSFLWHAFRPETGRFHNFLSYERQWLDDVGSDDSHGRAIWALGTILGRSQDAGLRGSAGRLFDSALPAVRTLSSPRAWAYVLLGIHEYLKRFSGDRAAQEIRDELIERLTTLYRDASAPDWCWFEDILAYSNARIPQALLLSGRDLGCDDVMQLGFRTLRWLTQEQHADTNHFVPIGSNGFYIRGGQKSRFDQQPVEAVVTVSACLDAWRITHDPCWYKEARRAFEWFLGRNDLGLPLYDAATGGCRDGLHPDRANQNQGAESTLSFLIALEEMRQSSHVISS